MRINKHRNEGKWEGGKGRDENAEVTSKQLRMKCQKNLCMDVVFKHILKTSQGQNEAKCTKGSTFSKLS